MSRTSLCLYVYNSKATVDHNRTSAFTCPTSSLIGEVSKIMFVESSTDIWPRLSSITFCL